jgi:hypothetical protein
MEGVIEDVDYISDSSNNDIQNPLLLSQHSLLSYPSYDFSSSQSPGALQLSSFSPTPPLPLPSFSSQDLFHEYNTYDFLKIFKKLIPKFLKYHQLHRSAGLTGQQRHQQEQLQKCHHYHVNDKVKVNLRQYQDFDGIILKIRKS